MKIITRHDKADNVAIEWLRQHPLEHHRGRPEEATYYQLAALPKGTPREVVDKIAGLDGWWTKVWCDECGECDMDFVVGFGDDPNRYGENAFHLCGECIKKAAKLVKTL